MRTLYHDSGGIAEVFCDGEKSDYEKGIVLRPGDTVTAKVEFLDATTALVTLSSSSTYPTKERTLRGVPACGLRFGAGMQFEGQGVTLVARPAPPRRATPPLVGMAPWRRCWSRVSRCFLT